MKNLILIVLALTTVAAFAQQKPQPKSSKPYTCVAGPDEKCASDLWYAEYQKLRALVAKYQIPPELAKKYQMPQDVQDQVNGWATRLAREVPAGYQWNEEKQRYTKIPTPQAAAPENKPPQSPAPSTPAPAERK